MCVSCVGFSASFYSFFSFFSGCETLTSRPYLPLVAEKAAYSGTAVATRTVSRTHRNTSRFRPETLTLSHAPDVLRVLVDLPGCLAVSHTSPSCHPSSVPERSALVQSRCCVVHSYIPKSRSLLFRLTVTPSYRAATVATAGSLAAIFFFVVFFFNIEPGGCHFR